MNTSTEPATPTQPDPAITALNSMKPAESADGMPENLHLLSSRELISLAFESRSESRMAWMCLAGSLAARLEAVIVAVERK